MTFANFKLKAFSFILVIVMLVGLFPTFMAAASADGVDVNGLTFTYNGATYNVTRGSNGNGDGVSWVCDSEGIVTFTFTKSGTFEVTRGNLTYQSATLIGGGAGGGGGNARPYRSGSGGGGGEIKTLSETALSQISKSFSVTIGEGGKGGVPRRSTCSSAYSYTTAAFQCLDHDGFDYAPGKAGGDTYIIDDNLKFLASGGASDGGAEGIHYIDYKLEYSNGNSGSHQTATRAASGGSGSLSPRFTEPAAGTGGNFNSASFTCGICGRSRAGYYSYGGTVDPWGSAWESWVVKGGEAFDGAGAGGTSSNQHDASYEEYAEVKKPCSNSLDDNNGADATSYGAGGGGGALASGLYGIWQFNHCTNPTGSTHAYYFAGHGGDGYQGKVDLTASLAPADDEGRAGGGGGFYGGLSNNIKSKGSKAGGGSGYVGTQNECVESGATYSGISPIAPGIPDQSKDGYIRVKFIE